MPIKVKQNIKRISLILGSLLLVILLFTVLLSRYIKNTTAPLIYISIKEVPETHTAIVLGASVKGNGRLSMVLEDRVETAYRLYQSGKVKRLLLSGDNGSKYYDEPTAMKTYLVNKGVPAEHIYLDYAGFDTYDSMYRAQAVFDVKDALIITQNFHLPRALYIAQRLDLNYKGYVSDLHQYSHESSNKNRELLANVKAFMELIYNKKPTYLGKKIPIDGPPQIVNNAQ